MKTNEINVFSIVKMFFDEIYRFIATENLNTNMYLKVQFTRLQAEINVESYQYTTNNSDTCRTTCNNIQLSNCFEIAFLLLLPDGLLVAFSFLDYLLNVPIGINIFQLYFQIKCRKHSYKNKIVKHHCSYNATNVPVRKLNDLHKILRCGQPIIFIILQQHSFFGQSVP